MEWTDMDEWERSRWRDLWLIALGAALVDPAMRERVAALEPPHSQAWLKVLHHGVREKDPTRVWHALEEGWRVPNCDGCGRRVLDVILEMLPMLPVSARIKRLAHDVAACRDAGDVDGAEAAEAALREMLQKKRAIQEGEYEHHPDD